MGPAPLILPMKVLLCCFLCSMTVALLIYGVSGTLLTLLSPGFGEMARLLHVSTSLDVRMHGSPLCLLRAYYPAPIRTIVLFVSPGLSPPFLFPVLVSGS